MDIETILTPTTQAANSDEFDVEDGASVTVISEGIGSETLTVEILGSSFNQVSSQDATTTLSSSNTTVAVRGPGRFRIVKPTTVSAVGVYVAR